MKPDTSVTEEMRLRAELTEATRNLTEKKRATEFAKGQEAIAENERMRAALRLDRYRLWRKKESLERELARVVENLENIHA